ncbi:UNKNOWN [Stylonychia lemnae]|uniref:Uncharacterized protein n=1 Tax=Stylonychia lemnae TaxID=5949 RepID=A0A078ARF9_STYLE|nr:UNKNOWN [Stylonychia lemnae]|eukprot:CDW83433.1 UNKNOWN [Stylonychia lemnae]
MEQVLRSSSAGLFSNGFIFSIRIVVQEVLFSWRQVQLTAFAFGQGIPTSNPAFLIEYYSWYMSLINSRRYSSVTLIYFFTITCLFSAAMIALVQSQQSQAAVKTTINGIKDAAIKHITTVKDIQLLPKIGQTENQQKAQKGFLSLQSVLPSQDLQQQLQGLPTDQVIGVLPNQDNLTPAQQAQTALLGQARGEVLRQLELQRQQISIQYQAELESLKASLTAQSGMLPGCDWACVDQCSLASVTLVDKVQCFQLCNCYTQASLQYTQNSTSVFNTLPQQTITQQQPVPISLFTLNETMLVSDSNLTLPLITSNQTQDAPVVISSLDLLNLTIPSEPLLNATDVIQVIDLINSNTSNIEIQAIVQNVSSQLPVQTEAIPTNNSNQILDSISQIPVVAQQESAAKVSGVKDIQQVVLDSALVANTTQGQELQSVQNQTNVTQTSIETNTSVVPQDLQVQVTQTVQTTTRAKQTDINANSLPIPEQVTQIPVSNQQSTAQIQQTANQITSKVPIIQSTTTVAQEAQTQTGDLNIQAQTQASITPQVTVPLQQTGANQVVQQKTTDQTLAQTNSQQQQQTVGQLNQDSQKLPTQIVEQPLSTQQSQQVSPQLTANTPLVQSQSQSVSQVTDQTLQKPAFMTPSEWNNFLAERAKQDYLRYQDLLQRQQQLAIKEIQFQQQVSQQSVLDQIKMKHDRAKQVQEAIKSEVEYEVNLTVENMQVTYNEGNKQFADVIVNTAHALQCNAQCVQQCTKVLTTLEGKAQCLDICQCLSATATGSQSSTGFSTLFNDTPELAQTDYTTSTIFYTMIVLAVLAFIGYSLYVSKKREELDKSNELQEYFLLKD